MQGREFYTTESILTVYGERTPAVSPSRDRRRNQRSGDRHLVHLSLRFELCLHILRKHTATQKKCLRKLSSLLRYLQNKVLQSGLVLREFPRRLRGTFRLMAATPLLIEGFEATTIT